MRKAQLVGVVTSVLLSLSLTSVQMDQSSSTSSTPDNSCIDTYPSYCVKNTNKCIDRYPNVLKYCQKTCNRCSTTSPATTSPVTTLPSVTSTKNTPTIFDVRSSTKVLSTHTTTYDSNTKAPLNTRPDTVTSVGTLCTAYLVTWLGTMICIVHTWTTLQE